MICATVTDNLFSRCVRDPKKKHIPATSKVYSLLNKATLLFPGLSRHGNAVRHFYFTYDSMEAKFMSTELTNVLCFYCQWRLLLSLPQVLDTLFNTVCLLLVIWWSSHTCSCRWWNQKQLCRCGTTVGNRSRKMIVPEDPPFPGSKACATPSSTNCNLRFWQTQDVRAASRPSAVPLRKIYSEAKIT